MFMLATLFANQPPRQYTAIEEAFHFVIAAVLVAVAVVVVWRIDRD
jgi:hypothetical protein